MCSHARKIGDNYGLTCQDCGETIEGYGGWFGSNLNGNETCSHGSRYKSNDLEEECVYCQSIRATRKDHVN